MRYLRVRREQWRAMNSVDRTLYVTCHVIEAGGLLAFILLAHRINELWTFAVASVGVALWVRFWHSIEQIAKASGLGIVSIVSASSETVDGEP